MIKETSKQTIKEKYFYGVLNQYKTEYDVPIQVGTTDNNSWIGILESNKGTIYITFDKVQELNLRQATCTLADEITEAV